MGRSFHRVCAETCLPHRQRHLQPVDWEKGALQRFRILSVGKDKLHYVEDEFYEFESLSIIRNICR